MSKSKKRRKAKAEKRARTAKIIKAGGLSKYAQKQARNNRGNHAPTSPFYVPPVAPAQSSRKP